MPHSLRIIELSKPETEHVLCHVLETLMVYEYPTPSIFSALTRLSIVSFLRGKGINKEIESVAVDVFRQLTEFAQDSKKYEWFVSWSHKLVELIKEKNTEHDGLL